MKGQPMTTELATTDHADMPPALPAMREGRDLGIKQVLQKAFESASKLALTADEQQGLRQRFPDEDVEILPSGECYIPHILIRNRLSEVLGEGQWSMLAIEERQDQTTLFVKWVMLVRGYRIGETWAGKEHYENKRVDLGDDYEGSEGVAVRRIAAKLLHCGDQVWQPAYCRRWVLANAIQVWVKAGRDGKPKPPQWRRKDSQPLWNETGPVDSPRGRPEPVRQPETRPEPAKAYPPTPNLQQSLMQGLRNAANRGTAALKAQWECLPTESKRLAKPEMAKLKAIAADADPHVQFENELMDSVINPPATAVESNAASEAAPVDIAFAGITVDEQEKLAELLKPFGGLTKTWQSRLGVDRLEQLPAWTFGFLSPLLELQKHHSESFDDFLADVQCKNLISLKEKDRPAAMKKIQDALSMTLMGAMKKKQKVGA